MDGKGEIRTHIAKAKAYRDVFMCKDGIPAGSGKEVYEDLMRFAGLFQAKYEGNAHDMTKTLGRVEVIGRINYFLGLDTIELGKTLEDK